MMSSRLSNGWPLFRVASVPHVAVGNNTSSRCTRTREAGVWYENGGGWLRMLSPAESPGAQGWSAASCAEACAKERRCFYWTVQLAEQRECHIFARRGVSHTNPETVHGSCDGARHTDLEPRICDNVLQPVEPRAPLSIPVYVIHVAHAHGRWQLMTRQLSKAGIVRYSLVDAVTFTEVDDECRRHQITLARGLRGGDAAVALSHLRALRRLHTDGVAMALILEDDALLGRGLMRRLERVLTGAPQFDLFFAGWYNHLTAAECVCRVAGRDDLRMLRHDGRWQKQWWGEGPCVNTGLNGYVASAAGATRILRAMATIHSTIDTQLGDATYGPSPLRLMAAWPPDQLIRHNWSTPSIRVSNHRGAKP